MKHRIAITVAHGGFVYRVAFRHGEAALIRRYPATPLKMHRCEDGRERICMEYPPTHDRPRPRFIWDRTRSKGPLVRKVITLATHIRDHDLPDPVSPLPCPSGYAGNAMRDILQHPAYEAGE